MDLQNKIIGVVGRKGSGKSTMFQRIMERQSRLVLFDTVSEHAWVPNKFQTVAGVGRYLAWAEEQSTCAGRLVPQREIQKRFSELCALAYDYGRLVLGVEEMPMLGSAQYVPEEFDRCIRLGRHRGLSIVWTAQRMAECPRRLTAACDWFVLFGHREPRDLSALAERCGSAVAARVSELGLHDWLVWNVVSGEETTLDALLSNLHLAQTTAL